MKEMKLEAQVQSRKCMSESLMKNLAEGKKLEECHVGIFLQWQYFEHMGEQPLRSSGEEWCAGHLVVIEKPLSGER